MTTINLNCVTKSQADNCIKTLLNSIKDKDTVVTDNQALKEVLNKLKCRAKSIQYAGRKELHSIIEKSQPTVVILMFPSTKTEKFTHQILPDTTVYKFICSDSKKIVPYVEELEALTV